MNGLRASCRGAAVLAMVGLTLSACGAPPGPAGPVRANGPLGSPAPVSSPVPLASPAPLRPPTPVTSPVPVTSPGSLSSRAPVGAAGPTAAVRTFLQASAHEDALAVYVQICAADLDAPQSWLVGVSNLGIDTTPKGLHAPSPKYDFSALQYATTEQSDSHATVRVSGTVQVSSGGSSRAETVNTTVPVVQEQGAWRLCWPTGSAGGAAAAPALAATPQRTPPAQNAAWVDLRERYQLVPWLWLLWATGVAVDAQGNVYTGNPNTLRDESVVKLSPTGQPLAKWGSKGKGPGQFDGLAGLAVDAQGNVYVSEDGNNRVQKLSPSGQPLAQWGSKGAGPGQFDLPAGLAVDAKGNVYVADSGNNRIQKLSPTGQPLAEWGSRGSGPGQFNKPAGVTVDAAGNVYVADTDNNRIQKLSPTAQPLAQWGSKGKGPGQFDRPESVAVDAQGNIWVADLMNSRIQKLSPTGRYLTEWGWSTIRPGGASLLGPQTVVVDRRGNVYVEGGSVGSIYRLPASAAARN